MKIPLRVVFAVVIMALPSLPLVILALVALHDPPDRYWGWIYLAWGTVFAALSSLSALRVIRRARSVASGYSPKAFSLAGFLAWGLSFLALVVINLTPLCVGQNNGDGHNSIVMSLFLAVLWFAFMTLPVAAGILVASLVAATMANRGS